MNSRRRSVPRKPPKGQAGGQLLLQASKRVDPAQVRALFRAAGWTEDMARYSPVQINKLLRHSYLVLTAWADRKLVGLATAVCDGVLCGMVLNLVVHPDYRRRGLGTRLLRELARSMNRQRISCLYALGAPRKRARAFFGRAGFRRLDWDVYIRLAR